MLPRYDDVDGIHHSTCGDTDLALGLLCNVHDIGLGLTVQDATTVLLADAVMAGADQSLKPTFTMILVIDRPI